MQPLMLLDSGAQAERTALAWQRAGLGLLGVGAVLLHINDAGPSPLALVVGLLDVATGAVLAAVVAPLRYRRALLTLGGSGSPLARRSCIATAACTVASCLAAGVSLLQAF